MTPGAQERAEMERLYAAAREVDRIAHHEVHHLEAMACVIKRYAADAIAQALEEHNKTHNGPDSLYAPRLSMDAKVAQAMQAERDRVLNAVRLRFGETCMELILDALRARPAEPCGVCGDGVVRASNHTCALGADPTESAEQG